MEYEAWMMALLDKYIVSKGGIPEEVFEVAGVDYESDFENIVYHPYNKVQEIYRAVNANYGKHEGDYLSFLASLYLQCLFVNHSLLRIFPKLQLQLNHLV